MLERVDVAWLGFRLVIIIQHFFAMGITLILVYHVASTTSTSFLLYDMIVTAMRHIYHQPEDIRPLFYAAACL